MTEPTSPPRLARWLVDRVVPDDVRDDVSGDLLELFYRDRAADGAARAAARYWRHAVSCAVRFGAERCRNLLDGGVMAGQESPGGIGARTVRSLIGWRMDLTLAVRMLFRNPALSTIAVFGVTVAIGIAATMFTIIGEQLNPSEVPLPDGDRIVAFQKWDPAKHQPGPLAPQDFTAWQEQLSTVRAIGAYRTVTKNLILPPAAPEPIEIAEMTATGFEVAGIPPVMGRVIRPDDERADATPVVVIGYEEWRRRFGARADALHSTVQLGGTHHTVVGVMPEGFAFPIQHAYWIPLRVPSIAPLDGSPALSMFGRLAPGATLQSAQAELTAASDRARAASPAMRQDVRPRVVRYARQYAELEQPDNKLALELVRFFVTLLLVVVSINIAVLVYARTAARQAEIAVRTALGASRGRIVAQLFGEGLVLAGIGAAAGLAGAAVALRYIRDAFAQTGPLPFWLHFDLSAQTVFYVVGLTLAAAALIGAVPAWKATGPRVQSRLQALTAGAGGLPLGRVWTALILLQVVFAVALLPMVVVRMSELARDGTAALGFAADEFLVAQLWTEPTGPPQAGRPEAATTLATRYREIERRIASAGNVRASAFSTFGPDSEPTVSLRTELGGLEAKAQVNGVSVSFLDTFAVPLLTGRMFADADASPGARTVIVNRSFARAAPSGTPVLGSRLRLATDTGGPESIAGLTGDWYQIVGVVEDFPPALSGPATPHPKVYRAITADGLQTLNIALRLHPGDVDAWSSRLRHLVADVDPTLKLQHVTPMDALLRQDQRAMQLIALVFAAMTLSVLLLSAAGIYAMMALSVTQRRREIGIRLALGAGRRTILWTMFSRAVGQLLVGAALGTGVTILLQHAADGGLMKEHATIATASVVLLVMIAGLLATLGPARAGLRIEPTEALRTPSN